MISIPTDLADILALSSSARVSRHPWLGCEVAVVMFFLGDESAAGLGTAVLSGSGAVSTISSSKLFSATDSLHRDEGVETKLPRTGEDSVADSLAFGSCRQGTVGCTSRLA